MNKKLFLFLGAIAFTAGSLVAGPAPVTGLWRTVDEQGQEKSVVEVYEQGGKIYGKIVSLKEPNEPDGKPKICSKCTGSNKDKPVIGLVIINGLSVDGDEYAGGTIMDPNNGKVYKCKMEAVEGGKKLKVRGFLGISLVGRTQTWLKK
jgi:uncharacterized protein (DUF2147 family)